MRDSDLGEMNTSIMSFNFRLTFQFRLATQRIRFEHQGSFEMSILIVPEKPVYVLRTCAADMTSREGRFTWPKKGKVSAPDWQENSNCGHGLHGFLWGEGNGGLADWSETAVWLVVKVSSGYIDLDGKVKFPEGTVVFAGSRVDAIAKIKKLGATGPIIGDTVLNDQVAQAGYRGTATAGYRGTATAGEGGTATAGNYGTATAGEGGTATAGKGGTATAGNYGTATAGEGGTILIRWWDGKRYRVAEGYVGEDGILPDVFYRVAGAGKLEAVKQ